MPYPDSRDLILQEKLRYVEEAAPGSSSALYESMCMKSVNQCIGRAIRHAEDFASIVLLDSRYQHPRVLSQFPQWIKRNIEVHTKFDKKSLDQFQYFYTDCATRTSIKKAAF